MATEAVEGDLEDEIAAEVIKLSRDVLERTVQFRSIVYSARGSGLVDDEFIDQLREQRSSEISNSLLLSMFMDAIRTEQGWFGRFLSLLSDSYSYRPLAEQLSGHYRELMAEKTGELPTVKFSEILRNAVETLEKCKAELQRVLNCYGLVCVQHCMHMLGMAVDYLHLEVKKQNTEELIQSPKVESVWKEKLNDLPDKAIHDLSAPFPHIAKDQPLPKPTVKSSEGHKARVKDDGVTTRHPDRSKWGYSEVKVIHEVLKCNRGYLEQTIPIDVIISTLHAQDVLLDYEYAEVTSQPFPIKKNRSLLDVLLRKAPSVFYQFCSILESQHGYEHIAHYLTREVQALDPTLQLEDKVKTFGITLSPKGAGPMSKTISQVVDALVDTDMVKSSIQSIVDKQIEMAEHVKKVHETEVSHLRKAVSDAKDTVNVVKAECVGFFQQMEQGKEDSSDHVNFLHGKIQDIVQACEDFQSKNFSNTGSSMETLVDVVNLEHRIGHLTNALDKKEREMESWRGTAKRREERLSESQKKYDKLRVEHEELRYTKDSEIEDLQNKWRTSQTETAAVTKELSVSKKKYDDLVFEHKEMRNSKDREIEDLQIKWEGSKARTVEVETELSESQKKYDDLVVEHKKMRNNKDREIEGLRIKWEASQARTMEVEVELTLSEERCKSLVAQHEELKNTKNKEIADIRHELETKTVAFKKTLTDSRDESAQQALRYEEMLKNSEKKIRELETALEKDDDPQPGLLLARQEVDGHKSEQKEANRTPRTSKDEYEEEERRARREERLRRRLRRLAAEAEEELLEEEREQLLELELERRAQRGYYSSLKLNKSDVEKNLQEKAVNGEHSVWGEGGNLNLSVWQDGRCHHLLIHQKKGIVTGASYSLDKKIYFKSILELCDHYMREQLPGFGFQLCW